ncbi:hypothetical protein CHD2B1_006 [Escherichia phage vB_EcoS-CHD2B1]|uniref:Uncharacterized protein n=1 Tax=Escherichia phage vB_EcoS-101114BS4 TaxID=2865793 RepID=A0AAE7XT57_9CAUD|nr:hypothetical protein P9606_gp63 [Escherichia phage vB_EcoS-101114BS4]QZI78427.1 hypothetical protein 22664B1_068 [Escherichia phage vB_EcoS-22664B1]QZI79057.1 hypothetical protein 101114B2_067 [Escherichia phage vB_EcoS-101114B2]QZI79123.1 hypothetical protein 101114BS4_063 [Escherichia phage vB_EcoS-101114BS4]USL86262.1 hypothetical protein CHD2B1_006 [Escherichia phage vB_EcoS-CHD2B1]
MHCSVSYWLMTNETTPKIAGCQLLLYIETGAHACNNNHVSLSLIG